MMQRIYVGTTRKRVNFVIVIGKLSLAGIYSEIPCDAENVTRIKLQARYFCITVYVPEQCYLCTIVFT